MTINLKRLIFLVERVRPYILIGLAIIGMTGFFPVLSSINQRVLADFTADQNLSSEELILANSPVIQSNSLSPISNPSDPQIKVVREIRVIATGYSSSPLETDETPFITAAGTNVRDGIIASNLLPFGTKVMLPDLYGNKIFVVEDRMNSRKGVYQVDIWFPSRSDALNFGAKLTNMEVVKEI